MFSLIITIISIALVAALAVATIYYGGSVFGQGTSQAQAGKVVNEGQQIDGAIKLYQTDHAGSVPSDLQSLIEGTYLKGIPPGQWSFQNDYVVNTDLSEEACKKANEMLNLNLTSVPSCSDPAWEGKTVCCYNDTGSGGGGGGGSGGGGEVPA